MNQAVQEYLDKQRQTIHALRLALKDNNEFNEWVNKQENANELIKALTNSNDQLWVVEALRWGEREKHSYVVGVFDDRDLAHRVADAEEQVRGGKYECVVTEHYLNGFDELIHSTFQAQDRIIDNEDR